MQLDEFPAKGFDGEDCGVVAGNEAKRGNDHVSSRDLEHLLPRCTFLAIEADLLEDDILVEVDAVETIGDGRVSYSEPV